jgi:hypothetical protein
MSLEMVGSQITAELDGDVLATVADSTSSAGQAGLGSGWNEALLDNLEIDQI